MPLAPPPSPPAHAAASQSERALVRAINVQRRANGLRRLRLTVSLTRVARGAAQRTVQQGAMSHAGLSTRMSGAGARFRRRGETLAWVPRGNQASASAVVRLWMRSPAHRAALLDPQFKRIGVGRSQGARGTAIAAGLASLR